MEVQAPSPYSPFAMTAYSSPLSIYEANAIPYLSEKLPWFQTHRSGISPRRTPRTLAPNLSRRSHKKSRGGCHSCKARKIKVGVSAQSKNPRELCPLMMTIITSAKRRGLLVRIAIFEGLTASIHRSLSKSSFGGQAAHLRQSLPGQKTV